VIRWLGPFLMIVAFLSNLYLAFISKFYLWLFILHGLLLLVPLTDLLLKRIHIHLRLLRLITHFYAMNLALLIGFFRSLKTIRSGVWERTERGG
jgi:hypothetical protein